MNDAEQPEFEELWNATEDVFRDQFILDATVNGISRWEKLFNMKSSATEPLEDRRFRILARMNESLPYTMRRLEQLLEMLSEDSNYEIKLYHEIYTIFVKIKVNKKTNIKEVEALLRRIVPANMVVEVYERLNSHKYVSCFTHGDLKKYTHWQIRNEKLKKAESGYTYEELEAFTYEELEAFSNEELEGS